MAEHLRYRGTQETWLAELRFDSEYFVGWDEDDIKELLFRKLPSITDLERWHDDLEGKIIDQIIKERKYIEDLYEKKSSFREDFIMDLREKRKMSNEKKIH